jgi:hypothetical protein
MNKLEKSGIVEFSKKTIYHDGFYSAELLFNGKIIKKKATFFPAHWSNEQVIDAIFEAYDNFIKNGAQVKKIKGGKYFIEGKTATNNTIEIAISLKGKILTAYPIF